uniref:BPTI/Kunitz inhibitor domain-containing protein n=1 Tax=Romanomermis culicivorax TaxID=13658 RepID=A0A915JZB4_ROMCU
MQLTTIILLLIVSCSMSYGKGTDPCLLKINGGDQYVAFSPKIRWGYNVGTKKCVSFYYYRRGNANNFLSKEACEKACCGH